MFIGYCEILKSVQVLLLNMYSMLELSGLFYVPGKACKVFQCLGGEEGRQKKLLGCGLLGGGDGGGGGQYPSCNEFLIIWSMVPSSEKVLIFKISRMEA